MEKPKTFEELTSDIRETLFGSDGDWVAEVASEVLYKGAHYDGDSVWMHNGEKLDFDELMDKTFENLSNGDGEYIAAFYNKACESEIAYDGDWVWVAA